MSTRKWNRHARLVLALFMMCVVASASAAWNNPYPESERGTNTLYAAFAERPKHLDPARSYSENEYAFIAQIYEPPFQYHYLRRPYELIPLAATTVPRPVYFDKANRKLPSTAPASTIAYSLYEIKIRPGIQFQPHPAFARSADGDFLFHKLSAADLSRFNTIADFPQRGTRELVAADYIYQIKRLAHPKLHSPILGVMAEHIVGYGDYARTLAGEWKKLVKEQGEEAYLDLTRYPISGVEEVDRYTYRVKIRGKYPQFLYWMAMPFFAPMAPEADRFFSQPGMAQKNLTLDWYPVGTGPYMLTVNNPNRQMVLERNPNFRGEPYPSDGESQDTAAGLLKDAGKPMPFIDKVVFSLEKESIPYWTKFLQGYYDRSAVPNESFDQAVRIGGSGDADVSDVMKEKGISLLTSVETSTFYFGFNMLDPVVGGYSERARKLRQALSIAIDVEEQIAIFQNGRGIAAQGPLPPGIFGYKEGQPGMNPYVYEWIDGKAQRKSIEVAKKLLAEAGYANGQDQSGRPLLLYFDTAATGPEQKARLDWLRKQLEKLNIQLVIRATDYNRFQEKMRKGDAQLFQWGWNADYPDPENFLFLLHGPNKKVGGEGENAANYDNAEFNRLFERMRNMENGPERQAIIDQMMDIARRDAPWVWGIHPKRFSLQHAWVHNVKPNNIANNTLKYLRIDPRPRVVAREEWNRPVMWPIAAVMGFLVLGTVPAIVTYRRREARSQRQANGE